MWSSLGEGEAKTEPLWKKLNFFFQLPIDRSIGISTMQTVYFFITIFYLFSRENRKHADHTLDLTTKFLIDH